MQSALMRLPWVMLVLAACPLSAQTFLSSAERAKVDSFFDQLKGEKLKCQRHTLEPWVDFAFRFELRYSVECEIAQFGGKASDLLAFVRVKPEAGEEVVLGDHFQIPAAPGGEAKPATGEARAAPGGGKAAPSGGKLAPSGGKLDLRRTHSELGFSGALATGVGAYTIELLLVDDHNRIYRQHWKARAFPKHGERDLKFSLAPNTVTSLTSIPIPALAANTSDHNGRLTVLLNAAPLNPWSRRLRAWDRAFLLDSLSSLLRQLPYGSVRVVAFNLEQQHEIFRRDSFKEKDMRELAGSLRSLELGTIRYSTLQRKLGWAELLTSLVAEEARADEPAEALIFLGPTVRLIDKVPQELLTEAKPPLPLFCVSYYPRVGEDFPDSIQYLTSALKGKVFRIHTPGELAQNLEKLRQALSGDAAARAMRPLPK